jgi:uncharacterized protein YyaL (SSP411 family)
MNRLSKETSPYLLQHKNNPVDWYPWGDEALDRSVEENKPIILSIGYSACHWCHVMEHESFENVEIAEIMNKNFICIKVDREERPDLDHIYQNVAQALTRGGGWPLTVFLTPARRPFFGGTYFPPDERYGRPGFKRVLENLTKAYANDPIGIAQNAMKLTAYIQAAEGVSNSESGSEKEKPNWASIDQLAELLLSQLDWENGGIGGAPKFPNAMIFSFLWRYGTLKNHEQAKAAVLLTLRKMASGGIYDQLGGGFSRYSVDATWSVPHFEKMLYDNGLLLKLYSEVVLTENSGLAHEDRELFVRVIRETVTYLLREMVSPQGGFFAAQDADSEGEEGKYFAWDPAEIKAILTEEDSRIFSLRFGVSEEGNFEHGKTVLFLAQSVSEIAQELTQELKRNEDQVQESVERSRKILFEAREKRIKPGTDNKILSSWNGLAISGLSWAGQALRYAGFLDESRYCLQAAERAFELICKEATAAQDGKLFNTTLAKGNAYLDDYAFMAMSALDLARFSSEDANVSRAQRMAVLWMKRVMRHFKDEKGGGYFFTSDDHEELIHRPKTVFDQAIPSGTALILQVLMSLTEIDSFEESAAWTKEWESQLQNVWPQIKRSPYGCGEMLNAAMLSLVAPIVISGPSTDQAVRSSFVFRKPADKNARTSLLVCHRQTCSRPLADLTEVEEEVAARATL